MTIQIELHNNYKTIKIELHITIRNYTNQKKLFNQFKYKTININYSIAYMSSFKVQKMKASLLPVSKQKTTNKEIEIDTQKVQIQINQINLLNYQIETMLFPIELQVQGQLLSKIYLKKNLKILTMSLSDKDLFYKIQNVFNRKTSNDQGIFQLLCQWSKLVSINLILQNFSQKMKIKLLTIIYTKILLQVQKSTDNTQQEEIKKQLVQISSKLSQKQRQIIMNQIQNSIQLRRNCFSITQFLKIGFNIIQLISGCQNQSLKHFFLIFNQKLLAKNQQTLLKIIKQTLLNHQKCKLFIKKLFSASQTAKLKIIIIMSSQMNKLTISQIYNIFHKQFMQKKPSLFFLNCFRQWLNENITNSQRIISQLFQFNCQENQLIQRNKFINQCYKYVDDQSMFKKIIEANNICSFLKSNKFQFANQSLVFKQQLTQKQQSAQININFYKCLKHCQNHRKTNMLLLNKNQQIQYWPKLDNLQTTNLGKNQFKASFQQFLADIKIIQNKLLRQNKTITIWHLVVQVQISLKTYFLSFNQLKKLVNCESLQLQQNIFLKQYGIGKKTKVFNDKKEAHPIINQAKVVKFLKKAQKAVSDIQIANFLQTRMEDCKLILNKLVNKGYIQIQQNSLKYSYLA